MFYPQLEYPDVTVKSKNKLVAAASIQLEDPYLDQEKWLLLCNC